MSEATTEVKTKKATKKSTPKPAAVVPGPNPELAAKYKDLFARQGEHAATHQGCDKTCQTAKAFRLEMKALDGEAKKLHNGAPANPLETPEVPAAPAAPPEEAAAAPAAPEVAAAPKKQPKRIKVPAAVATPEPAQLTTTTEGKPKAEAAPKVAKVVATKPQPADFMMYVGGAFYTKEQFIAEAGEMGVSKRLPTFRIPPDMVVGKSKVWLVTGGERKAGIKGQTELPTEATSVIFGYFIPDAIEFVAGEDGDKTYADVIGYLKTVPGSKVIEGNPAVIFKKRLCGERKVGGTYLVTKEGKGKKSPVIILDAELPYIGNHFRGLMRLDSEATGKLAAGEGLTTLVADKCMSCEADVLVAPDSRKRAAVERRRMERGEQPKWNLECHECKQARRDAEKAAKAAEAAEAGAEEEQTAEATAEEPAAAEA